MMCHEVSVRCIISGCILYVACNFLSYNSCWGKLCGHWDAMINKCTDIIDTHGNTGEKSNRKSHRVHTLLKILKWRLKGNGSTGEEVEKQTHCVTNQCVIETISSDAHSSISVGEFR